MRTLFAVTCLMLFAVPTWAGESSYISPLDISNETVPMSVVFTGKNHTMTWTSDGTVLIDDKPLEKLSDPEIKAAIKSIAEYLNTFQRNDDCQKNNSYLNAQTSYLLQELEKCRAECGDKKK